MNPLVSILIDTYNHERFIEDAIRSALDQDFPREQMEILVVDDGSTDRTPDIVRKFAPRVRLLSKPNGGQASALNIAIPEVKGEIVAFLDGDDWFASSKLSAVVAAFDSHPEAGAVGHGRYEFREQDGSFTAYSLCQPRFVNLATRESAREASRAWRSLVMSALTVRRAVLKRILPIPERLVFCADTPIQVAALAAGAFVLQEPLFYFRQHEGSLYSSDRQNTEKMRRRLDMHRLALEASLDALMALGVPPESARELIWPAWVEDSRKALFSFGGSRRDVFRTELRSFQVNNRDPGLGHRAFKYAMLGAATVLLSPRSFYRLRNWYSGAWYYLLNLTYAPRHAIGLNRSRSAGSGAKPAN